VTNSQSSATDGRGGGSRSKPEGAAKKRNRKRNTRTKKINQKQTWGERSQSKEGKDQDGGGFCRTAIQGKKEDHKKRSWGKRKKPKTLLLENVQVQKQVNG